MELTDTQELVKSFYKDEKGDPIILSPSQDLIFRSIAKKEVPRVHIMCHTRFGKSMTTGLAVLTRAAFFPEKWAIIAGTKDKAKIIMDYILAHMFDNEVIKRRFFSDEGELDEESIRRYRNKNRVSFKVGESTDPVSGKRINLYGEIFVGSAKDALGLGAQNIVEDEAALIEDNDHSLVMRMLGDNPTDNFLVKIGNPFARNHFLASYMDPKYRRINIDCWQSMKEGRITQEVIDENAKYIYFPILYENKFPSATDVDESGWMYLVTEDDIRRAVSRENQRAGIPRLGVDVARGGRNYNVWVLRYDNWAKVIDRNHMDDLTEVGDRTVQHMKDYNVDPTNVFIDDTGVGGGVTDYLKKNGYKCNPVTFGSTVQSDTTIAGKKLPPEYANVRALCYAGKEGVANWLKQTGQIIDHAGWIELTKIRYKKNLQGKTIIEPKEDMRKRGIESPDIADALALTFAPKIVKKFVQPDPVSVLSSGVQSLYPGMPG